MLYQMHIQDKKDLTKTEMVEQSSAIESAEDRQKWTKQVVEDHPLPEGKQWLCCNEKSEHFVWAVNP